MNVRQEIDISVAIWHNLKGKKTDIYFAIWYNLRQETDITVAISQNVWQEADINFANNLRTDYQDFPACFCCFLKVTQLIGWSKGIYGFSLNCGWTERCLELHCHFLKTPSHRTQLLCLRSIFRQSYSHWNSSLREWVDNLVNISMTPLHGNPSGGAHTIHGSPKVKW